MTPDREAKIAAWREKVRVNTAVRGTAYTWDSDADNAWTLSSAALREAVALMREPAPATPAILRAIAAMQRDAGDADQLRSAGLSLRAENERLRTVAADFSESVYNCLVAAGALSAECDTLRAENARLQADLAAAREELRTMTVDRDIKVENLTTQLAAARADQAAMAREQLEAVRVMVAERRDELWPYSRSPEQDATSQESERFWRAAALDEASRECYFRLAALPQPKPKPAAELVPARVTAQQSGDWTEDAEHENGSYQCRCVMCGAGFTGHKRRAICKVCHNKPAAEPVPAQVAPVALVEVEKLRRAIEGAPTTLIRDGALAVSKHYMLSVLASIAAPQRQQPAGWGDLGDPEDHTSSVCAIRRKADGYWWGCDAEHGAGWNDKRIRQAWHLVDMVHKGVFQFGECEVVELAPKHPLTPTQQPAGDEPVPAEGDDVLQQAMQRAEEELHIVPSSFDEVTDHLVAVCDVLRALCRGLAGKDQP